MRDFISATIDKIAKYKLLTNHFKPDQNYKFTSRLQHISVRVMNYHWLVSFFLLVYNKGNNSVFCLPCVLFDKTGIFQKSSFVKNSVVSLRCETN